MSFRKAVLMFAAVVFCTTAAFAGGIDSLANMLAEKGYLSSDEAQQLINSAKEESKPAEKKADMPKWIQNMEMKGDIRVRHQMDWSQNDNTRNRTRLRARFGVETKPFENVKAAFGVATGAQVADGDKNPTSTNHTFQSFNKAPLFLDYAYIQYEPVKSLKVSGGKLKNKTQVWNPTDLIWDGDINPDGFAVNFDKKINGQFSIFVNAGWYVLNEARRGDLMPDAYIAQPGISFKKGKISAKAGLAYQQFNMKDRPLVSNENGKYLTPCDTDFRMINPSIELKMKDIVYGLGLSVFGDYVKNTDDSVHEKELEGRVFGLSFGTDKIAELGTWQVKIMNRYLEKYAIPLGLGDSDAYGGTGNSKGYEFIVTAGLTKNLSFAFDYYQMEQINGDKEPKSLAQFDLTYKF